jgi:ketosteroid isomerase-like protein
VRPSSTWSPTIVAASSWPEHEFQRKGRGHIYRTAHIYRIEDGRLAEFREYPEDLYALDAAWA